MLIFLVIGNRLRLKYKDTCVVLFFLRNAQPLGRSPRREVGRWCETGPESRPNSNRISKFHYAHILFAKIEFRNFDFVSWDLNRNSSRGTWTNTKWWADYPLDYFLED